MIWNKVSIYKKTVESRWYKDFIEDREIKQIDGNESTAYKTNREEKKKIKKNEKRKIKKNKLKELRKPKEV